MKKYLVAIEVRSTPLIEMIAENSEHAFMLARKLLETNGEFRMMVHSEADKAMPYFEVESVEEHEDFLE